MNGDMMRNVPKYALLLAGALAAMGCEDKTAVSEKNFANAISKNLDATGKQCLGVMKWPVEITPEGWNVDVSVKAEKPKALSDVGLASVEQVQLERFNYFKGHYTSPGLRYSLTDTGKQYTSDKEVRYVDGHTEVVPQICFGKFALKDVVKWEPGAGPVPAGYTIVTYTVKLVDPAPWISDKNVQSAFREVRDALAGEKQEQKAVLKPTNLGWEVDNRL